MVSNQNPVPGPQLSRVWQRRFAFFSQYGHPNAPQARAAFTALSFGEKLRLNANLPAFLFGPLYKGMWRKGVTLLIAAVAVGAVISMLGLPAVVMRGAPFVFGYLASMAANYAYYLHLTRHSTSWNPFEGIFGGKPATA